MVVVGAATRAGRVVGVGAAMTTLVLVVVEVSSVADGGTVVCDDFARSIGSDRCDARPSPTMAAIATSPKAMLSVHPLRPNTPEVSHACFAQSGCATMQA